MKHLRGHPAWAILALVSTIVAACSAQQLQHARDAASAARDKRETICRFVDVWAPDMPELRAARLACKAGEDLQHVAAAYAGCEVPKE